LNVSPFTDTPQKPHHVQVHILNTSAVNVSWAAPVNDSNVIGYMVQISCDDDTLTRNTSVNYLIINELEVSKNYTITMRASNRWKSSLRSDPVFVTILGKSLPILIYLWMKQNVIIVFPKLIPFHIPTKVYTGIQWNWNLYCVRMWWQNNTLTCPSTRYQKNGGTREKLKTKKKYCTCTIISDKLLHKVYQHLKNFLTNKLLYTKMAILLNDRSREHWHRQSKSFLKLWQFSLLLSH
jgi:hypothetical protein